MDKEAIDSFWEDLSREEKLENEKMHNALSVVGRNVSKEMLQDIKEYIKDCENTFGFCFVSEPIGDYQEEGYQYEHIEGVYVNQTRNGGMTGDEFAGTICIEISEGEFLKFEYNM